MTDHPSSEEQALSDLLRRVQKRRLEDARTLLEERIAATPEVAARWLVLARLLALDPELWDARLQTALGQLGAAPLAAYRRAMRVLDDAHADLAARKRLEEWAALWSRRPVPSCREEPEWCGALESWLAGLRIRRAWRRLTGPERHVARLETMAGEWDLAGPGFRDPRRARLLARLLKWQEALSG
ncbi:MAG: hypothetical protein HQL95_09550 [Magnetococcales bacterium]|nr:hypothetical protein [Magnetococcales bacterium]